MTTVKKKELKLCRKPKTSVNITANVIRDGNFIMQYRMPQ